MSSRTSERVERNEDDSISVSSLPLPPLRTAPALNTRNIDAASIQRKLDRRKSRQKSRDLPPGRGVLTDDVPTEATDVFLDDDPKEEVARVGVRDGGESVRNGSRPNAMAKKIVADTTEMDEQVSSERRNILGSEVRDGPPHARGADEPRRSNRNQGTAVPKRSFVPEDWPTSWISLIIGRDDVVDTTPYCASFAREEERAAFARKVVILVAAEVIVTSIVVGLFQRYAHGTDAAYTR